MSALGTFGLKTGTTSLRKAMPARRGGLEDSRMREITHKWNNVREGIEVSRKKKADALEEYLTELERALSDSSGDIKVKVNQ